MFPCTGKAEPGKTLLQGEAAGFRFAAFWITAIALLSLSLFPALAKSGRASKPAAAQNGEYKIKTAVDLVILRMTVLDRKGGFASGLDKDNFQVFEDGAPQTIQSFSREDIPVTVGLIVDNSGSMRVKRPDVAAAALAFARSSNERDEMFVVNFNDTVSFGLPPAMPFTNDPGLLQTALSSIATEGQTALYDAISYGLQHLRRGTRDRKALIVVSDGGDNASKHTLNDIVDMTMHSDAIIYTIGLFDQNDPDRNPHVLSQLAKATGGEAFLPASLADVVPTCERIAADIRNQYTAAYEPTNKREDGTFRSIKVRAKAPGRGGLSVRTRAGYYAPSNSRSSRLIEAGHAGTAN